MPDGYIAIIRPSTEDGAPGHYARGREYVDGRPLPTEEHDGITYTLSRPLLPSEGVELWEYLDPDGVYPETTEEPAGPTR